MTFQGLTQNFSISGSITDSRNGEDLYGASVIVQDLENTGANTNVYGFYSITLSKGVYTLIYRSSGYKPVKKKL